MEILLFVMMICNYESGRCTLPDEGLQSPYYSDQRQCEEVSDSFNKLYRSFHRENPRTYDSSSYVTCFKKTANGLAETIPDRGLKEKLYRTDSCARFHDPGTWAYDNCNKARRG